MWTKITFWLSEYSLVYDEGACHKLQAKICATNRCQWWREEKENTTGDESFLKRFEIPVERKCVWWDLSIVIGNVFIKHLILWNEFWWFSLTIISFNKKLFCHKKLFFKSSIGKLFFRDKFCSGSFMKLTTYEHAARDYSFTFAV